MEHFNLDESEFQHVKNSPPSPPTEELIKPSAVSCKTLQHASDTGVYRVWISRLQRGVEKKTVAKGKMQGERTKTGEGWKGERREKEVSDGVRGGYPPGGATIAWMEEMSLKACWANHEKTGEPCIVPLAPIKLKTGTSTSLFLRLRGHLWTNPACNYQHADSNLNMRKIHFLLQTLYEWHSRRDSSLTF